METGTGMNSGGNPGSCRWIFIHSEVEFWTQIVSDQFWESFFYSASWGQIFFIALKFDIFIPMTKEQKALTLKDYKRCFNLEFG